MWGAQSAGFPFIRYSIAKPPLSAVGFHPIPKTGFSAAWFSSEIWFGKGRDCFKEARNRAWDEEGNSDHH
jgi:hypothetical protein